MDIVKLILNFIWQGKRPRIVTTILKGKDKFGGLTLRLSIKLHQSRQCGIIERVGKRSVKQN